MQKMCLEDAVWSMLCKYWTAKQKHMCQHMRLDKEKLDWRHLRMEWNVKDCSELNRSSEDKNQRNNLLHSASMQGVNTSKYSCSVLDLA